MGNMAQHRPIANRSESRIGRPRRRLVTACLTAACPCCPDCSAAPIRRKWRQARTHDDQRPRHHLARVLDRFQLGRTASSSGVRTVERRAPWFPSWRPPWSVPPHRGIKHLVRDTAAALRAMLDTVGTASPPESLPAEP